ncbi:putative uncharacterized protein DDB_G0274535 [Achroia grisella]|uniref:putative uncharacterized protein DDB_G0274535 n=1 Tax=Achroia grisella TaxID=688607 RepID=UPI0027D23A8C|nr:putative uncharacterized protein DDB_G0274535 [Achroia grisella]
MTTIIISDDEEISQDFKQSEGDSKGIIIPFESIGEINKVLSKFGTSISTVNNDTEIAVNTTSVNKAYKSIKKINEQVTNTSLPQPSSSRSTITLSEERMTNITAKATKEEGEKKCKINDVNSNNSKFSGSKTFENVTTGDNLTGKLKYSPVCENTNISKHGSTSKLLPNNTQQSEIRQSPLVINIYYNNTKEFAVNNDFNNEMSSNTPTPNTNTTNVIGKTIHDNYIKNCAQSSYFDVRTLLKFRTLKYANKSIENQFRRICLKQGKNSNKSIKRKNTNSINHLDENMAKIRNAKSGVQSSQTTTNILPTSQQASAPLDLSQNLEAQPIASTSSACPLQNHNQPSSNPENFKEKYNSIIQENNEHTVKKIEQNSCNSNSSKEAIVSVDYGEQNSDSDSDDTVVLHV